MLFRAVLLCLQRGNLFADTSIRARATIADLGARFIRPGSVILAHGYSRVVLALLQRAIASVSLPCAGLCCAVHTRGWVGPGTCAAVLGACCEDRSAWAPTMALLLLWDCACSFNAWLLLMGHRKPGLYCAGD
jgi:hypothetical protein